MKILIFVVTLAFMVSACETVAWQRPNTDQQTAEEDYRACRWEARLRARRALTLQPHLLSRGSAGPVPCRSKPARRSGYDSYGDCPLGVTGGRAISSSSLFSNRVALENDFSRRCMRDKGYELLNVDEAESEIETNAKPLSQ